MFRSRDHIKLIIETPFDHILQAEEARTLIQVLRSSKVIPMISLVEIKKGDKSRLVRLEHLLNLFPRWEPSDQRLLCPSC